MTLGNSNDRDPHPQDLPIGDAGEHGGDVDAGAAEAAAAAENEGAVEPAASGGGVFGPIIELIQAAQKIHPAAGFLLVVLALFVVAGAVFKIIVPLATDTDPFRMILYVAFLLLFLVVLVATIADFVVPPNGRARKAARWQRLILLLVMTGVGGYAVWQVSNPTPGNCPVRRVLSGPDAANCDVPIAVAKKPVIEGYIESTDDPFTTIKNASVKILLGATPFVPPVTETGAFTAELPDTAKGQDVEISVNVPGYQRIMRKRHTVTVPTTVVRFALDPEVATGPTPIFKTISATRLLPEKEGVTTTAVASKTAWFNGQNWRYDIFYCQPPQGDAVQSKILAVQLQKVLEAQPNVGAVRVRMWPALGTAGYEIPASLRSATVLINNRAERAEAYDALERLWTPYLAAGETINQRPVDSAFKGYISLVVCRSANAGA